MLIATEFSDDDVYVGVWRNLLVVDIAGTIAVPHLARLVELRRRFDAGAQSWVALSFTRASAGMPDRAARRAASESMKNMPRAAAVVTVIEVGGIAGVALRTMVRTMNTLAGVQQKIVSSLDESLPFVTPHVAVSQEELNDALLRLRASSFAALPRVGMAMNRVSR